MTVPSATLNASEQAGHAVTGVVVTAPFGHARHHRLGTIQGLLIRGAFRPSVKG
jgi:hypothetical protein